MASDPWEAQFRAADIDLGDSYRLWFTCWAPDRGLNPQYDGIPDVPKYGAIIRHLTATEARCAHVIHFDLPEVAAIDEISRKFCEAKGIHYPGHYPRWKVEQWEPLTLSPSILCRACGDHGYVREGKWVRA